MSETAKREKKEIIISENRDFKGVWIPERLYLTREFTPNEKFLLIEIYSLTKKKNRECFANNKHFADFVGLKENTVQKMMLKFENAGYIKRNYEYREGTKEIDRRTIKLTQKFYDDFINETENADFFADGMENNQEGYGMESTDPIDKNPQGNGLKVGDKYNNFKSNSDLSNTSLSDTSNSFSNEKDNSKEALELHNSHFPEEQKNESRISMSLGVKQKQSKEKPLKDMPTRAKEIADSLVDDTELSEGVQQCIAYFLEKYKRKNRKEHLPLRNETLQSVVEVMLSSLTVPHDEDLENRYQCVFYPLVSEASEWEDRKEVIDKYFDTEFREKCDYSLVHFTQRDIITHIMQKCSIGEDTYWFYSESVD